jgi:hypothetical protein
LQSHGDLDEGQDTILHSDGVSLEQACCDLNSITFGGGGDPAEHHCDAIENLVTSIPWTADSGVARGVVIAFMTATSKKAKSGYSAEQIGWMLKDQGLLTYLVCEPICRRLDALAAEANAMVIPISNDPSPELMAEIVSQISASIVQTLATGGTAPMPV